jgi:hypothetical protein
VRYAGRAVADALRGDARVQVLERTGPVLGVVLTGDITNGKTPITYLGVNALQSGYFGLYTKDRYARLARYWAVDHPWPTLGIACMGHHR